MSQTGYKLHFDLRHGGLELDGGKYFENSIHYFLKKKNTFEGLDLVILLITHN